MTHFTQKKEKAKDFFYKMNTKWLPACSYIVLLFFLFNKEIALQLKLENLIGIEPFSKEAPLVNLPEVTKVGNGNALQKAYIERFASVAQKEMQKFGIPASIKLAQGLLESQAGKSPLAVKNNNHFGIKCFSKTCKKGHCSNFSDDSHKDFFRVYTSAWESYRAHSEFLQKDRYKHLQEKKHYKDWANGLQEAGYATDPQYAEKLIRLIESLDLQQYDT
jgi:flagellum-specific peptidoglycan hydrolase FlgJ